MATLGGSRLGYEVVDSMQCACVCLYTQLWLAGPLSKEAQGGGESVLGELYICMSPAPRHSRTKGEESKTDRGLLESVYIDCVTSSAKDISWNYHRWAK